MDAPSSVGAPGAVPPPPPSHDPGPRRLRRRPDDGHIAGVCAGVAEYFAIDPLLVRIAAVVLLLSGPGFIAYVLMWIFVPAEAGQAPHAHALHRIDRKDRATQVFGIVLLGLGVSVIWGDWWSPARGWLFPIALMAVGAWLLLRPDDDEDDRVTPYAAPVPPTPTVPSIPPTGAEWSSGSTAVSVPAPPGDPIDATEGPPAADGEALENDVDDTILDSDAADATLEQPTTQTGGSGGWGGEPPSAPWDVPPSPAPGRGPEASTGEVPRHRHRHHPLRRMLGPTVFGLLLVWTGIAWLTGVGLTTGLAVGLVIIGSGCVFGSFVGGTRALILPALLVGVALAVTAAIDIPLSGPIGEQRWSPDDRLELQDVYEVSMGEGTLDLSDLPVGPGEEMSVRATVGLGHLVVLVAEGEPVFVNAEVGAGEIVVFGEKRNGVGVDLHESFGSDGEGLVLDLEVGMGQIEVRRVESGAAPDPVLPR